MKASSKNKPNYIKIKNLLISTNSKDLMNLFTQYHIQKDVNYNYITIINITNIK